jgi:hypothetical protein
VAPGNPRGKLIADSDAWKRDFEDARVQVNLTAGVGSIVRSEP